MTEDNVLKIADFGLARNGDYYRKTSGVIQICTFQLKIITSTKCKSINPGKIILSGNHVFDFQ